jgi:hypothetical protein
MNRSAFASFVLLVLAGCAHTSAGAAPAAAPAPAAPAAKCTVAEADGGIDYTCGNVRGVVVEMPGSPEAALDHYRKELEKQVVGKGKVRVEPAPIADLAEHGLKVLVDWRDKSPTSEGYVFAFDAEDQNVVLVSCVAAEGNATLEECHQALVDLGDSLHPAEEPTLLGRAIATPEGCTMAKEDERWQLVCGRTSLIWWHFDGKLEAGPLDEVVSGLGDKLEITKTEAPTCSILGQKALCRRVSASTNGQSIVSYFGIIEHEGGMVLVMCSWPGDAAKVPELCSPIFGKPARARK